MARRPNWRAIKIHRNYTVDETAEKLAVAKGTVLRWLKSGDLPAVKDRRPFLILGRDLIAFGKRATTKKLKCRLNECYCFTCRAPRTPAGGMADLTAITEAVGDLQALCSTCGGIMHKRVSMKKQAALAALFDLQNSS